MTFFEAIESSVRKKGGPLCVGIDPRIPSSDTSFDQLCEYGMRLIDACHPYCVAFKPQLAFFECHGADGWAALESILNYLWDKDRHFPVILDAKRGDIGSTATAYAKTLLDRQGPVACTLSPYLGFESVQPFLEYRDAAVFILCRTTNPGAQQIQMQTVEGSLPLYLSVADAAVSWNPDADKDQIGLVVAGNDPSALYNVRQRHPHTWFLAPGIGHQGGKADQAILFGARADGWGVLASASRSISDAPDAAQAARELRDLLNNARKSQQSTVSAGFSKPQAKSEYKVTLSKAEHKELLKGLFEIGAFKTGDYTLKSGQKSPFYIDLRRLSGNSRLLSLSGKAYASMLANLSYDHIAGIPVAAIPLASAAALFCRASLIYPRLEKKRHGSGVQVEGVWEPGQTAVMLDDLITTGGSKIEAAEILRQAGLTVNSLVVLIERGVQGRREMQESGIELQCLITIEELLDFGISQGFVGRIESDRVREYVNS